MLGGGGDSSGTPCIVDADQRRSPKKRGLGARTPMELQYCKASISRSLVYFRFHFVRLFWNHIFIWNRNYSLNTSFHQIILYFVSTKAGSKVIYYEYNPKEGVSLKSLGFQIHVYYDLKNLYYLYKWKICAYIFKTVLRL